MSSVSERLAESLSSSNVTVVQTNDFKKRAQLLFRVNKIRQFLPVIDFLLSEEERQDEDGEERRWAVDISRVYMRYNGRLIYAWRFVLQSKSGTLQESLTEVRRLLDLANRMNIQPVEEKRKPRTQFYHDDMRPDDAGFSSNGTVIDGEVMEMPLVGVDTSRNKPQAPILTAGVRGMGKKSGVSSRGAHLIGPTKGQY